ncbi:diguanylate cyclase [Nitrogeniibacter mangrovi]|uniref:Sensor protein FixL n=1 Tax=Nitrogeniibacter mangrovi TaxID=2016596 RepID=A0A6C1B1V8_9RHOO|nr:diguanylate cyclase [Nitrogeniibacter mangrovi]QID17547.1 diguanylate cyclase [Nitrogeniibacter mangrovi]
MSTLLAIAIIQLLAGTVAYAFAGPVPGEVSFMPAVAVALYACLRYGHAAVPGAFLAALVPALLWDRGFDALPPASWWVAEGGLAVVAALQAAAGAWLVRRYVSGWQTLMRPLDGIRLLAAAVCLGTLPWALTRTGLRVLWPEAGVSETGVFFAAWLAQMIGMAAILPIAFVLGFRATALWRSRVTTLALPAMAIVVLVLGAHQFALQVEANQNEDRFSKAAGAIAMGLNRAIQEHLGTAVSTRRFVEAAAPMTRAAFDHFALPLLPTREGLRAIAWAPRVAGDERAAFERAARAAGEAGFAMRDWNGHGALRPAASRAFHFPLRYVVPRVGADELLGFDLASEPIRRSALEQVLRTGQPVVSEPVRLVGAAGAIGVLAFAPVHGRHAASDGHGEGITGVVVSKIGVGNLIAAVLAQTASEGLAVRLEDATGGEPTPVLYASSPHAGAGAMSRTVDLRVENRRWQLTVTALPGFVAVGSRVVMWLVMVGTFVLVVLMDGYLLTVSGQRAAVQMEVEERTAQLRVEVARREAAAISLRHSESRMRGVFDTVIDGLIIIDDKGIIDAFNPAAERIFGWRADEVIGRNVRVLMPEPYHGQHDGYLADYHRTGRRKIIGIGRTVEGKRKDGSVFPLDLAVTPFHLDAGVMFVGVTRDASDRVASAAQIKTFNAQLRDMVVALEQRDRALTELTRVNEELMACNDRQEAAGVIRRGMQALFPGSSGMLAVSGGASSPEHLHALVQWGGADPLDAGFGRHDCRALQQGRVHRVGRDGSPLRCPHVDETFGDYVCLPLVAQGQVQGLITIDQPAMDEAEAEERRRLLDTVGESIKLSLSNLALRDMLREQVVRDPLTRLYNRRYLEEALEREVARARREGGSMGCAVIDLDHFKAVNDSHGHDVGDSVLRALADLLKGWFRSSDIVCRFGGEEFVVIFPSPDPAATRERLEALQQAFFRCRFNSGAASFSGQTFSVGLAVVAGEALAAEPLLKAADEALYEAKAAGRNRVVLKDPTRDDPAVGA